MTDKGMSRVRLTFFKAFTPVVLVVILATVLVLVNQRNVYMLDLKTREEEHIKHNVDRFLAELEFQYVNMSFFSRVVSFHLVEEKDQGWDYSIEEITDKFRIFVEQFQEYESASYLDVSGKEIIRIKMTEEGGILIPDVDLENRRERSYYSGGLRARGGVYVSRITREAGGKDNEKPPEFTLHFASAADDGDGKILGVVALNYRLEEVQEILEHRDSDYLGITYLVNPEGWCFMESCPGDDLDPAPETAGKNIQSTFSGSTWGKISSNTSGQFQGEEGLVTYAAIKPFDDNGWDIEKDHRGEAAEQWKVISFIPNDLMAMHLGSIPFVVDGLLFVFLGMVIWQWSLARTRSWEAAIALKAAHDELEFKVDQRTHELADALTAAETASRTKSDFLASMSHELRTPLNAIIGFSEVLIESYFGELNEKQADYMEDIHTSGHHLLSLINDILDLTKVEAGKTELVAKQVNVKDLIEGSLLMIREKCAKHNIALDSRFGEGMDDFQITADERKLKQVMYNLLSNASKFTPDGGAIVIAVGKEGDELVVSVEDSGCGIDEDDLVRIFQDFYQVKGGIMDKTAGTGLGLPLARNLVELHGGRMWAESEGEGKGAKFTFTLPVKVKSKVQSPMSKGEA